MTWLLGLFLVAHGLIHASFLSPTPPQTPSGPQWPFHLDGSWLLGSASRPFGIFLVAVTVIAFILAGASALGFVVPRDWWDSATLLGSIAGTLLLVLYFHPWLSLGILLNAALIVAILGYGWRPVAA
jgi:hypothetical protein